MRIVVIAQYNPNLFPALHQIAAILAERGAEVDFLSSLEPAETGVDARQVRWTKIPATKGIRARLPWFRSQSNFIIGYLNSVRPDWIMAQHEYLVPTLAYRATIGRKSRVAAYFADYHGDRRYLGVVGKLSGFLDAYVDICDVRLQWRQKDWPRMKATPFIIRQAPFLRHDNSHITHKGLSRVVLTGSNLILKMNQERLSSFIGRLCERGVALDWLLPGSEDVRAAARGLSKHPLYAVRDPLPKPALMEALGHYDVGLFLAPIADADLSRHWDRSVFLSGASNKIGEYIAAGLVVAHTGNPGLAYLPDEVCAVFDPTDPMAGADQLADQLADRATVERKRQAALRFHLDEMNFEAQAAPFIRYVMEGASPDQAVGQPLHNTSTTEARVVEGAGMSPASTPPDQPSPTVDGAVTMDRK